MVSRFLATALVFFQVRGREAQSCPGCTPEGLEDASFLQAKAKGPHLEGEKHPNKVLKKFNHHRHLHEKVVDSTDYRQDCRDSYEKVKDLSLAERCPNVKIMTLAEVQQKWQVELKRWKKQMEEVSPEYWDEAMEDLKADFPDYLDNTKPVVVEGSVPRQLGWRAADHWGKDELISFLGNATWERTTFNYPDWIIGLNNQTTLASYIANQDSKENVFLFASESGCGEEKNLRSLVDKVRSQFAPSPEWAYAPDSCEAIIAIDGIGSSHGFHCHDPVWNTQIEGTKHWWLLDPFYGSNMEDDLGLMDWGGAPTPPHTNFPFEYPNGCAMLREVKPPEGVIKCVVKPGEMLILPDSWIHATCGLTEYTIAAGGWLGGLDNDDKKEPPHGQHRTKKKKKLL